ncbi:DUF5634 family protein [Anaerobacillus alkalilacustris]|uniref:DUF5634 family protein n=1 Tax=Anaerobacillus alkalilacustris TaxID=393763 RepID=UPI000A034E20|nr:DUF5634 family protein [Anaerobacillus alkalilacustris]
MDFISREAIIREMTESLPSMIDQYELEDIAVFEEEGEDDRYYFGFTIRKNGDVYMIHQPF